MARPENQEAINELFECLQREFGNLAPHIIKTLVRCVGGVRLTFPGLQDLYREERNRLIRREYDKLLLSGVQSTEALMQLSNTHRIKPKQVRRIVQKSVLPCITRE